MAMIKRYEISFLSRKGRKHVIELNDKQGAEILFLSMAKEKPGRTVNLLDRKTKETRVRDY